MELVLHIMEYIPNKLELSILAKIPMEYYIGVTCILLEGKSDDAHKEE